MGANWPPTPLRTAGAMCTDGPSPMYRQRQLDSRTKRHKQDKIYWITLQEKINHKSWTPRSDTARLKVPSLPLQKTKSVTIVNTICFSDCLLHRIQYSYTGILYWTFHYPYIYGSVLFLVNSRKVNLLWQPKWRGGGGKVQSSRGRQLNYDHRGLIHGERKVNVLWQQKWRGGGGSKIPFLLHNSAMLPTSKKTATMEDKLLEAALTVVDGCPAGAAAGGARRGANSRGCARRCSRGANGSVTHTDSQEDGWKAFIWMWPCILSCFKLFCENKWKLGAPFLAFFNDNR